MFEGGPTYRHEKFTDGLLDAISEEASIYAAVVAALKCNIVNGIEQDTVYNFANDYVDRIQGCNSDFYFEIFFG